MKLSATPNLYARYCFTLSLSAATLALSPRVAPAADENVIDFLNAALANKHAVLQRSRVVHYTHIVCVRTGEKAHLDCQSLDATRNETYQDVARVRSQLLVSVSPIAFDQSAIVTLPTNAYIERVDYVNCGQDPYTTGYSLQVSGTDGYSVAKQHTLSFAAGTTVDQNFKVGVGLFGGSTDIKVDFSMTTSDSTTNTETHSTTVQRTWPTSITIGVGHAGHLDLLALQQTIRVPFSANVIVDGDMEDNISGYVKASQLLSEAERTMPFSGAITATGLSGAYTGNFKSTDPINCSDPSFSGKVSLAPGQSVVPAALVDPELVKGLRSQAP